MSKREQDRIEHIAPEHLHEKAFVTLLSDSIEHAYLATVIPNPGSTARFARSSIVSSALSIESAANICLAALPLSPRFAEEVERKFGPLEKFELILNIHKGPGVFDRGCQAVQRIKDLINLRNDFVHPKSLRLPVQNSWETNGARHATMEAGTYNQLKLGRSYRTWTGDAAVCVVRAVFEFFDQFFFEWCKWEPERTAAVLCPALVGQKEQIASGIVDEIELLGKAETLWKVSLRWLRFDIAVPIQVVQTASAIETKIGTDGIDRQAEALPGG